MDNAHCTHRDRHECTCTAVGYADRLREEHATGSHDGATIDECADCQSNPRCPVTHQTATHDDGEVIHCSLPTDHAGDHRDASRANRGEVIAWPRTTIDEEAHFFTIHGGWNYSHADIWLDGVPIAPAGSLDCNLEAYATRGDAFNAWRRRRNDIGGRFPLWGDDIHEGDEASYVVVECAAGQSLDGWKLAELCEAYDDELSNYVDEDEDDDVECDPTTCDHRSHDVEVSR